MNDAVWFAAAVLAVLMVAAAGSVFRRVTRDDRPGEER